MKIALIGYGNMGKTIEKLAVGRGHEIIMRATSKAPARAEDLRGADIAIEFTSPASAVQNIQTAFEAGIPIVTGSTGWFSQLDRVKAECENHNGALFYASNFSLGVNVFQVILQQAAEVLSKLEDYRPQMNEIHHTGKKDAPSGTALTLSDIVLDYYDLNGWTEDPEDKTKLLISSERLGDVKGTHEVSFISSNDEIKLEHKAFSRDGFANGAIDAAEWIQSKKGCFTMKDLLKNIIG